MGKGAGKAVLSCSLDGTVRAHDLLRCVVPEALERREGGRMGRGMKIYAYVKRVRKEREERMERKETQVTGRGGGSVVERDTGKGRLEIQEEKDRK